MNQIDSKMFLLMKNKLSLAARVFNLINSCPPIPPITEEEKSSPVKGITIRFSPDVRKFIEYQAENLQCSVQDVVNLTMTSVMRASEEPHSSQLDVMCSRFWYLFEMHNIALIDIPNLLAGTGIKRSDLLSTEKLLDALDNNVLAKMSEIFNVNIDWLKGASDNFQRRDLISKWYKNVGNVTFEIARSYLEGMYTSVKFICQANLQEDIKKRMADAEELDDGDKYFPVGVVLQKEKQVNGFKIHEYRLLRYERWNYSKCRDHIKYLLKFCERTRTPFDGIALPKEQFFELFRDMRSPKEFLESTLRESWLVEDIETNSIQKWYLDGNDPEAGIRNILYCEKAITDFGMGIDKKLFTDGLIREAFNKKTSNTE